MPLWSRRRNADREAAEALERGEAARREAAKRAILEYAARQRRERDRAFPPEHRPDDTERQATTTINGNPAKRRVESTPSALGQRCSKYVDTVLLRRWSVAWSR